MLYPIEDQQLKVKKHELKISHNPEVEIFTDFFGKQGGRIFRDKNHIQNF
jgi:hypothetical protein